MVQDFPCPTGQGHLMEHGAPAGGHGGISSLAANPALPLSSEHPQSCWSSWRGAGNTSSSFQGIAALSTGNRARNTPGCSCQEIAALGTQCGAGKTPGSFQRDCRFQSERWEGGTASQKAHALAAHCHIPPAPFHSHTGTSLTQGLEMTCRTSFGISGGLRKLLAGSSLHSETRNVIGLLSWFTQLIVAGVSVTMKLIPL